MSHFYFWLYTNGYIGSKGQLWGQGRRQRGGQWCPAPHLKSVPSHFTFGRKCVRKSVLKGLTRRIAGPPKARSPEQLLHLLLQLIRHCVNRATRSATAFTFFAAYFAASCCPIQSWAANHGAKWASGTTLLFRFWPEVKRRKLKLGLVWNGSYDYLMLSNAPCI